MEKLGPVNEKKQEKAVEKRDGEEDELGNDGGGEEG